MNTTLPDRLLNFNYHFQHITLAKFFDKILTKSYHGGILELPLEFEVICIEHAISQECFEKAQLFLKRIHALLYTNECVFQQSEKNILFDRQYSLKNEAKVDILKTLTAEECMKVEPNNNPRYPESEVYTFIKSLTILSYGEEENVKLYIKMYLNEQKNCDVVIVISFHQEGMH